MEPTPAAAEASKVSEKTPETPSNPEASKVSEKAPETPSNPEASKVSEKAPETPSNKINPEDHVIVAGLIAQVESVKRHRKLLKRELAFATVDLYVKTDQLNALLEKLRKKHTLKRGEREIDLTTGDVVKPTS